MPNGRDLSDGEEVVLRLHPHWKTLMRPTIMFALIVAAALALLLFLPYRTTSVRLVIGGLALLGVIAFCTAPTVRWLATRYELTTRRFRLRSGVLTRSGRDFPLARISDVSFQQGAMDRLLGCGRLIVESPGEHGQLVLTEIPQVRRVQSTLFQLVEDEQLRLAQEDR